MNGPQGDETFLAIDSVCDEFESLWLADKPSSIGEFLARAPQHCRDALFVELLRIDTHYRRSKGEQLTADQYGSQFPEYRDAIQQLTVFQPQEDVTTARLPQATDESTLAFTSQPTDSQPRPQAFGDYELLNEIARGGMGVVYRAQQRGLNRTVALKMILSGQLAGAEEVRRFRTEAEAAANLNHIGIVPVYDVGEHNGQHYFSMGFVEGQSLQDKLRDGPLDPQEAARIVVKIAQAVHFAHQKGVIHRDLKPANVLLDVSGEPRITDFGLAKRTTDQSGMTATGQILGTPSYMPPEQAEGEIDSVNELSDVYALGAILYASLTGRPPFQARNPVDTLRMVLDKDPPSIKELNPSTPHDLDTIAKRAMHKQAQKRFPSAEHFAQDVQRYLNDEPILARPVGRIEKSVKWCKRYPAVATLLVLTSVLAVTAASFGVLESIRREEATIAKEVSLEVNNFLKRLLRASNPDTALGKELTVREILDQAATDIDQANKLRPEVIAEIRTTLGNTYQSLGELKHAEKQLRLALDIEMEVGEPERIARARAQLAGCLHEMGNHQEAIREAQQAYAILKDYAPGDADAVLSLRMVGESSLATDQMADADEYLSLAENSLISSPSQKKAVLESRLLHSQSVLALEKGDIQSAIAKGEECLALRLKELDENHPLVASAMTDLAAVLYEADVDLPRGEELLIQALGIRRKVLPEHHPLIAYCLHNLGAYAFVKEDELDNAHEWFAEAVQVRRIALARDHADLFLSLVWLAKTKLAMVDKTMTGSTSFHEEAVNLLDEAIVNADRDNRHVRRNWNEVTKILRDAQANLRPDDEQLTARIEALLESM